MLMLGKLIVKYRYSLKTYVSLFHFCFYWYV